MLSVHQSLAAGLSLIVTSLAWGQTDPPADALFPEPVLASLVEQLAQPDFATREAASEQLRGAGPAAVSVLRDAALSANPESAVRATQILAELYQRVEFPIGQSVEDAVDEIRRQPSSAGEAAERTWALNSRGRETRAVAQLESLGARVKYRVNTVVDEEGSAKRPNVQMIILGRNWKGGADGLRLMARFSRPSDIFVYYTRHTQITEAGLQELTDLGFRTDLRGAFLGISNNVGAFINPGGAPIGSVEPNSPAAKAGLRPNDVIVKFGDNDVRDFEDLIDQLKGTEPGDRLVFTVIREGEELIKPVQLGDW